MKTYKTLGKYIMIGTIGTIVGCTQMQEPKRSSYEYDWAYARTSYKETCIPVRLEDVNNDGHIDFIWNERDGQEYGCIARDSAVVQLNGANQYSALVDSETINLADRIVQLENELSFRLDSLRYVRNRELNSGR